MTARKAAVLGSPVAHSKSPLLHLAAYRALGLADWTYERLECTADELPRLLRGFGPEWVGVSVTMPGKFAALQFADERTERAELVGSANTLVRTDHGWRADNTDIDGVAGALGHVRRLRHAIVLGSGGTAPAAIVALADLGAIEVTVVARNRDKAARLLDLGAAVGVTVAFCDLTDPRLPQLAAAADGLVSTVPANAAASYAGVFARAPVLLDAIYDPWPTLLATAVQEAGGEVISGVQMLLHQAFSQVEQFTGHPAPREQMAAALG
ncbi:shikimate dehydrogenase [Mycolicibacterium sarraceniae]|uniref:Shikimate 5-dehydrogenase n=1 Tax=Mycolicibacterium sarraceniae TaxID=1534348 RepID=A0A7I7SWI3_9MYCO|nr:shikimate dehydrogenase [Mycolicibacterium sarraceniae]BBY61362.1 shikimate 5-dehydrogenase [Mycolicibacterium sarraceniae]